MPKEEKVEFFTKRRQMRVGDFTTLITSGDEHRVKASVSIPLSNRDVTGIPDWIMRGFEFIVKDDCPFSNTKGDKEKKIDGMSMTFYSTDTIKNRMAGDVKGLHGCLFSNFLIEKVGKADKAIVSLRFDVYVKASEEIVLWFYRQQRSDIFVEFDTTQATLDYKGEEDEEEDDSQGTLPLDEKEPEEGRMNLPAGIDPNDNPGATFPDDKRSITNPKDKPKLVPKKAAKKAVKK